jgi:hypothetical protein
MIEIAGGIILGFLGIVVIIKFDAARRAKKMRIETGQNPAEKSFLEIAFPGRTREQVLQEFPPHTRKEIAPLLELRGKDAAGALHELLHPSTPPR